MYTRYPHCIHLPGQRRDRDSLDIFETHYWDLRVSIGRWGVKWSSLESRGFHETQIATTCHDVEWQSNPIWGLLVALSIFYCLALSGRALVVFSFFCGGRGTWQCPVGTWASHRTWCVLWFPTFFFFTGHYLGVLGQMWGVSWPHSQVEKNNYLLQKIRNVCVDVCHNPIKAICVMRSIHPNPSGSQGSPFFKILSPNNKDKKNKRSRDAALLTKLLKKIATRKIITPKTGIRGPNNDPQPRVKSQDMSRPKRGFPSCPQPVARSRRCFSRLLLAHRSGLFPRSRWVPLPQQSFFLC